MFRRIGFICVFAFFAVMANAAVTITPKMPSKVSGCYQISDAAELYGFASIVNGTDGFEIDSVACGKLTKDVVVNENVLTASGNLNTADSASFVKWTPILHFEGSFDGQGHTISGLYFNSDTAYFVGLFGLVRYHTNNYNVVRIRNLGVVGSFFRGGTDVGAIVGAQVGSGALNFENVFSDSRVEATRNAVGGLIGFAVADLYIYKSYNSGNVVGITNVGGLSGYSVGSIVSLSEVYNEGPVSCLDDSANCSSMGGIAGYVVGNLQITNSYNRGSVSGMRSVGGLLGTVVQSSYISRVYNLGNVSGIESVGGIVGYLIKAVCFDNSYNLGNVSGDYNVGGIVGEPENMERFANIYNLGNVSGKYSVGGIVGGLQKNDHFVNVYNAGTVTSLIENAPSVGTIVGTTSKNLLTYHFENVFYLDLTAIGSESPGVAVTKEMMGDGTVAYLLHNYYFDGVDPSVWGQNVGDDLYPNFSGTVTGVSLEAFEDLVLHSCEGSVSAVPEKYLPGNALRLPKVSCEGQRFLGWYDNAEFRGDAVEIIPATATGTQEFWGMYDSAYSITYEINGGILDSAVVKFYAPGDSVVLLDPLPRNGYSFLGWYESEDFSGNRIRAIGPEETGDKIFYARWLTRKTPSLDGDGCYVISNASELYGFAAIANSSDTFGRELDICAKLANDIVVNENVLIAHETLNVADTANFVKWTPITRFRGLFDGQGHTISGLYYNNDREYWVGLFGETLSAEIKNLGVVGSFFRGRSKVGGVVGYSEGYLMMDSVYSDSRVEALTYSLGGLVGYLDDDSYVQIKNSYNQGSVVGKAEVGGLVGEVYADSLLLVNVYNAGSVSCPRNSSYFSYVGGIVGYSSSRTLLRILNGFNVGVLSGPEYVGGIAGVANGYNVFVNVYNVGALSSDENSLVAPIIASEYYKDYSIFENVFYLDQNQSSGVGSAVTGEMVQDGSLAFLLHNYSFDGMDASVWGQKVGDDDYPNFSGVVTDVPSDALEDLVLHLSCGEGSLTISQKYMPGYALRLPKESCEGYAFWGWYDNDEFSGLHVDMIPVTATGKQEFWARNLRMYKVTLETNGGTIESYKVESYLEGFGFELPNEVTRDGYVFRGWYESENFDGKRVFQMEPGTSGDKTFYARWFKIKEPEKNSDGCYTINNASELYGFAALVNGNLGNTGEKDACASLERDIVVNEDVIDQNGNINEADSAGFMRWFPINEFAGKFHGNGHTISGLYLNDVEEARICDNEYGCGFFGSLDENSQGDTVVIEDLGIEGSYFASHDYTLGALVGMVIGSSYSNKKANIRISNCFSTSTVIAKGYVGSLVGEIDRFSSIVVENCYNTGSIVSQTNYAGGLVGFIDGFNDLKMTNSYNTGAVMVSEARQTNLSLIGKYDRKPNVENCYYLKFSDEEDSLGQYATSAQFRNGAVATLLHDGVNGSIWGQNVGYDSLPNFSGKVQNFAGELNHVAFHTFDGDTAHYFDKYVVGMSRALPDASIRTGYTFSGWFADSALSTRVTTIDSADRGDLEFYAMWDPVMCYVGIYPNISWGGEVVGLHSSQDYRYGDTVEVEAVPNEGYAFRYWGDDVSNTNPKRQIVLVSDTSITANFNKASSSSMSSSSAKSSSSSFKGSSSSSAVRSSSSAKSSSSGAKSSSSKKHDPSDNDGKSSSSCSGDKCGKDLPIVVELLCNGKKCSDALAAEVTMPQFRVVVVGRDIQVMAARVGSPYALFDLQGRLLLSGQVGNTDFTIPAPHSGSYLVRIGNWTKRVTVR